MREGELLRALEGIMDLGARQLIITGGEPLLRPELPALVRRAVESGLGTLLLTNADLLDTGAARALRDSGLNAVSVSLNSLEEARRIEGIIEFLREKTEPALTATVVVTRRNAAEIRSILHWAEKKRLGAIIQPAYIPEGSEAFDDLSPHFLKEPEWDEVAAVMRDWARICGASSYVDYVLSLYGRGRSRPASCGMGREAFVVDCDGEVFPCFHRRDLPAGNILKKTPVEIAAELKAAARVVGKARCYGEHCVSLFCGSEYS